MAGPEQLAFQQYLADTGKSYAGAAQIFDDVAKNRSPQEFGQWFGSQPQQVQDYVRWLGTMPESGPGGRADILGSTRYDLRVGFGDGTYADTTSAVSPSTPPPETPGATAPAPPPGPTPENLAAFARLQKFLTDRQLGSLFTVDASGNPGGWLWEKLIAGVDTTDELLIAIEETPAFQNRYGIITRMRAQAVAGNAVDVPSVDQVLEYESRAADAMRRSGLPAFMYDHYSKLDALMEKRISVPELQNRIDTVWTAVHANGSVAREFGNFFGARGDAALAAFLLDPDNTELELTKMVRTAYAAGTTSDYGFNITQSQANRVAEGAFAEAGIAQSAANIAGMAGVFNENFSEQQGPDLTASTTGFESEFFGNAAARAQIEQRLIRRSSIDRSSFGGAAVTNRGVTGLSSATTR